MQLKKITGPECPRCGCQDGSDIGRVVRCGQPSQRRRCRHCAHTWTVTERPGPQTPKQPGLDRSATVTEPAEGETAKDSGPDRSATILYHLIRCPACGGRKCPVTTSQAPVRYHKCRDCGATFKSIEATD